MRSTCPRTNWLGGLPFAGRKARIASRNMTTGGEPHIPASDGHRMAGPKFGAHSAGVGLFCPQCGYNLRDIDSELCPECAYSLAFLRQAEPQLPWLRRDEIGRVRAYWRTIGLAIRHKKRFWEEISRPVSHRDAQRFRWITMREILQAVDV